MKYNESITNAFYENIVGRIEVFRNENFLCIDIDSHYSGNQIFIEARKSDEKWHNYFCGCDPFMLSSNIKEWLENSSVLLPESTRIEFEYEDIEDNYCSFILTFHNVHYNE